MTLQQLLLILQARFRVVAATAGLTVLAALAVSLVLPKQYTAGTAVVIDVKSPDPIAGLVLPGLISPGYMATQVDIIQSNRVARRVVERLRLDTEPELNERWTEATGGEGDIVDWLASRLQRNLDVKPSRESNVINIAYKGARPDEAARVANAFAQAFIDVNLELKVEPARQNAVWFEEQTLALRNKLESAQQALSAYRQKTGIVSLEESLDFETAKLNELSSQLTQAQGQNAENAGKSRASSEEALAEVLQNPLINNLKTDIARLESRLQESNVNLGKNHPQTQRTESELATLKARLASETRKIGASVDTVYRIGKQKEKDLAAAFENQKQRVLQLNRQRDELSILKRDVESAQRAFEGVSQRSAQTRLESLSVQTNAVVLNPAAEPTDPSRPKLRLNLIVALVMGTLLGVGMALLREFADRRVRGESDLDGDLDGYLSNNLNGDQNIHRGATGDIPLLASIPHLTGIDRQADSSATGPRKRLFPSRFAGERA